MRMRRGHVVELLIVLALGMFAVSVNAQPDSWGMCRDGMVAQPVKAGEFLMLGDPRVEDWATRWRSFKSANPHLRLEDERISFTENDTRIPFRVDTSLCGVERTGYTIRRSQLIELEIADDGSTSPSTHKTVSVVEPKSAKYSDMLGLALGLSLIGIWGFYWKGFRRLH